jgi:glycosyltransferase involved in cell wall biosynthesis
MHARRFGHHGRPVPSRRLERVILAQPLRIVHVCRAPVGGVFRHIADLADGQTQAGHEVGAVFDSSSGGDFDNRLVAGLAGRIALGVARIPMSRSPFVRDVSAMIQTLSHLARLKPDVVHCHGSKGGLYGRVAAAWLRRDRPVAAIYSPHGGSMHFDEKAPDGRLYFTAERWLGRLTDAIVHVCEFEAATYRRKVGPPACRATVVYNGLRPADFFDARPGPEAADFVFFGRYEEIKGVDLLLRAVAHLQAERGRIVTVNLFGQSEGGAMERYRLMASELGIVDSVSFHGPAMPREAFAGGRVVIAPSRKESMPYGILEAAAAGMPMIVTGVGGVLEPFSRTTLPVTVQPGDFRALAAAMEHAVGNPDDLLARAGPMKRAVAERCRVDVMCAAIEQVYEECFAARREPSGAGVRIGLAD